MLNAFGGYRNRVVPLLLRVAAAEDGHPVLIARRQEAAQLAHGPLPRVFLRHITDHRHSINAVRVGGDESPS